MISADEQPRRQAGRRGQPTPPPRPGQPRRVEHADARGGALAYLASWDVRRGGVIGRGAATTGQVPVGRLVDQVMQQAPFRSARRVVWSVDNGSSHRGAKAARELQERYPTLIVVHLPTPAAWLNQIESSCAIIPRTVLTPHDWPDLAAVEARVLAFATLSHATARPFTGRLTRAPLAERLAHLPPVSITAPATAESALQQVA